MKIPEKFHNSLSEKPFTHCKMCQAELLESEKSYLIEKAYRRFPDNGAEQLLFEVAICLQCASSMRSSLSADSVDTVNHYFYERSMDRREELLQLSPGDLLKTCLFSGAPLEDMEEYQVYAHCRGRRAGPHGWYVFTEWSCDRRNSTIAFTGNKRRAGQL
ncbi:MAG: hypothetical protein U5L96_18675 [Owenweeksia sp.]|nr:hypothetical protein [Owenweeksia sp.]